MSFKSGFESRERERVAVNTADGSEFQVSKCSRKKCKVLTEQMRPDVAGLRVDSENGAEARADRVQLWPMAFRQELVVAQPLRKVVVVHKRPRLARHRLAALAGVAGNLLGTVGNYLGAVARLASHLTASLASVPCHFFGPIAGLTGDLLCPVASVARYLFGAVAGLPRHLFRTVARVPCHLLGLLACLPRLLRHFLRHDLCLVERMTRHAQQLGRGVIQPAQVLQRLRQ